MVSKESQQPPKPLWAYAYHIASSQTEDRFYTISGLLDDEHAAAQRRAGIWMGRVVFGLHIAHLLILSDSPEQTREINHRLEAELKELEMGFSISVPLAVVASA